ncbi:MAG: hypothetical protein ACXVB0_07545 [Mucilaginibacter sp.]
MRLLYPKIPATCIALCLLICSAAYAQNSAKANKNNNQNPTKTRIDKINNTYLRSYDTLNRAVAAGFSFWVRPGNSDTTSEKIGDHLYKINKLLVIINDSKNQMINLTNSDCKEQLSAEFDNYTALINRSIKLKSKDSAALWLDFIRKDLIIKMNRPNEGLTGNMGLVSVKVSVLDTGANELPGYKVFIKPLISITKHSVLEYNPTPNAIKSILPGLKVIWYESNGTMIEKRTELIKWTTNPTIYDFNYEKPK